MNKTSMVLTGSALCLALFACRMVPLDRSVVKEPPARPQLVRLAPPASGAPTRLVAKTIDLDAPVVEMDWLPQDEGGQVVSAWNVPDSEAAWHRNSAAPGEGGNVVISGHNNSMGGRIFARLEELSPGDQITLWNNRGQTFVYEVRDKQYIRALLASAEAQKQLESVLTPTPTEQLTLITCWPNWTNTHRLIVMAAPKRAQSTGQSAKNIVH
jgi:sortase A